MSEIPQDIQHIKKDLAMTQFNLNEALNDLTLHIDSKMMVEEDLIQIMKYVNKMKEHLAELEKHFSQDKK